ncbi:MAG: hypothetical protein NZM31_05815 [Gemmatales bacterium]|nr:hypothetical protein [Gemmatales bacterium]MDW8386515.1 hypothetical protein [Gemmatales bacterium]
MPPLLDLLDVQTTRFDPVEAEITFTLPLDEPLEGAEMRGKLLGPRNVYTETVEIAYPLRPIPGEAGLLRSRVIIPEASLWEPRTPFSYHGTVELWHNGSLLDRRTDITHGLYQVLLRKEKLTLNGHRFVVHGLGAEQLQTTEAVRLREKGINLLWVRAERDNGEIWEEAERLGFFVLGELEGDDDEVLWQVEANHARRISSFGWVLPQHLAAHPQLWHNAMSLLHGPGRRHLIGIRVEETPLGAIPGHVGFVVCERRHLDDLAGHKLPRIVLLRRLSQVETRFEWPDPERILGWIAKSPT